MSWAEQAQPPPHVGDQLELELAGPGRAWLEPWGGKSPRELTRTFKAFSLRAPPAGGLHADEKVSAQNDVRSSWSQLDLFL